MNTSTEIENDVSIVNTTSLCVNTCTDCIHCGVCKHEDKLVQVYNSIKDKIVGHKFVDGIVIKCKYHKSKLVSDNISQVYPVYCDTNKIGSVYPKFDTIGDFYPSAMLSKDDVISAVKTELNRRYGASQASSDIDPNLNITINEDGKNKCITTKILGSSKKTDNFNKVISPITSDETFQTVIGDNTIREENIGQTTNV